MDEITTVKNQVKFAGWISMVEGCQNSGLSIRTWCKENNVCYKTYLYRLRRLRQMFLQEHSKEITPEITPLSIVQTPTVESKDITLQLDGISIVIPKGTDEDSITTVLRAVKSAW